MSVRRDSTSSLDGDNVLTYYNPTYLLAGDQTLVVELGDDISPEINGKVHELMRSVESCDIDGIVDLVPTYRSLMIQYDPGQISVSDLQTLLSEFEFEDVGGAVERSTIVHVPTLYGGECGPDLDSVAEHAGLTSEEVVAIHAGTDYLVYMMGFTPGFPYLGGLPEQLVTPRLPTPRAKIPAGSVGIAESQTGVYPISSPGGWRLIGRTPLRLFDAERDPPALIAAGNYVRFVPLDGEEDYSRIGRSVESGEYAMETSLTQ